MLASVLLFRVEALQFLQEDVAVGDRVVLVGHDEKLEDGPPAGAQEQNRAVPVRSGFRVHHNLIQLVPAHNVEIKTTPLGSFFFSPTNQGRTTWDNGSGME